ncbi:sensor domain-containing protein [Mycobacterium sp. ML4]
MRSLTAAFTIAAAGLLVAACGGDNETGTTSSSSSSASSTASKPPVAQAALANLLLTPAEIDTAMGTTGMSTKDKADKLADDSNKQWPQGWKWPAECMYAYGPGENPVYAGSGFTAAMGRDDTAAPATPGSKDMDPEAVQYLVLFPSATDAKAFFDASSKAWQACADRAIVTPGDANSPEANWKVGQVNSSNGVLTTTIALSMTDGSTTIGGTCQRALTVRNNVVIDVSGCGPKDPGDAGVKLANQIAGKVDKQ